MPPSPDPFVRRADVSEADAVGALTERVYAAGGWTDEAYSKVLRDGRSRIDEAIVLVATVDDGVVGTLTIGLPGTRFASIARPDEVEVRMLAVDETARRRGVARLLMAEAERTAAEHGFVGVVLSTEPDMHAAHRLYEDRGYVRQPDRDWQLRGFTLLVYRRELSARR
jgi:N-acetylglutamate synthase